MASVDSAANEVYNEVRANGSDKNWLLLTYSDNSHIVVHSSGSGGLEELKGNLTDDNCYFGYLRVVNTDDEGISRSRFVLITYKGESASIMRKGKMSVHIMSVKEVLRDAQIEIQAGDMDDLEEAEVTKRVKAANY